MLYLTENITYSERERRVHIRKETHYS